MNSFLMSVSANADFYEKWGSIFHRGGWVKDFWRELGWALVKFLIAISDASEKLLGYANKSLKFIASPEVRNFISEWKFVIYAVLIISILFFGIVLMTNRKSDKSKLLQNIIISCLVLMLGTTGLIQLTNKTRSFTKEVMQVSSATAADEVIKGAVVDLFYLDSKNFSSDSYKQKNNIPEAYISNIDVTERISNSDDVNNPDVFTKYLNVDKSGKAALVDIDDGGFVDFNNDTYYRYHIDYTTIFLTLLATAVVMFFTAFKVTKLVFDIIVHHILAIILAAADWQSGNKLKEVLKSLFALFFSVFMCSVMIQLYFMFASWASANIGSKVARGLLLLFTAFAVIDGPNIMEKIFGVDAGLASSFRTVSTLFFAGAGAARAVKGVTGAANAVGRGAARTAGAVGGFGKGLAGALKGDGAAPSPAGVNTQQGGNSNIANAATAGQGAANGSKPSGSAYPSYSGNANGGISGAAAGENQPNDSNISEQASSGTGGASPSGSEMVGSVGAAAGYDAGASNDFSTGAAGSEGGKSESRSISNQAAQSKPNSSNNYDYWGNKARNPRSKVGAAVRGKNAGEYWGEKSGKIGQKISDKVRSSQEARRNAKGD